MKRFGGRIEYVATLRIEIMSIIENVRKIAKRDGSELGEMFWGEEGCELRRLFLACSPEEQAKLREMPEVEEQVIAATIEALLGAA